MSDYKLVALDDYIQVEKRFLNDYSSCLPTSSNLPKIDDLVNKYEQNKDFIARAFAVSDRDVFGREAKAIQFKNNKEDFSLLQSKPQLISTLFGGVLTDNVGNTIILSHAGNKYFNSAKNKQLFHWGGKANEIKIVEHKKLFGNSISKSDLIYKSFRDKKLFSYKSVANSPINKQKINTPIILTFEADNAGFDPNFAKLAIQIAGAVISTIFPPSAAIVAPAVLLLTKVADQTAKNNGNITLYSNDVLAGLQILGVNTDSQTVQSGLKMYSKGMEGKWDEVLAELNIATGDPGGLSKAMSDNNYDELLKNSKDAYGEYKKLNKKVQASQDALTGSKFAQSPYQMLNLIDKELQNNPNGSILFNKVVQIATSRKSLTNHQNFAGINTETDSKNLGNTLLKYAEFQNPESTKMIMDMTFGGQFDENVMNSLHLRQIEDRMKYSKTKTLYLPYSLDNSKASCIAKELNTSGWSIYWEGGKLVNGNSSFGYTSGMSNYYLR